MSIHRPYVSRRVFAGSVLAAAALGPIRPLLAADLALTAE